MSGEPGHGGRLAEALELTRQMRIGAEEADWAVVAELERRRRGLLEGFSAREVGREEAGRVREVIEAILAIDRQVMAAGKTARQEIADKVSGIAVGRRAAAEYESNAGYR